MGLGRFRGGVGAARFARRSGADVLVTDLAPAKQLQSSRAALDGLGIEFRLGEHCDQDFTDADVVIVNPAVSPDNRFVQLAQSSGARITSEIRILTQQLPNRLRTIGVTGSAGKSTTTSMIGHCLGKRLPDQTVHVGGNIGGSLLDSIDRIGSDDWVVLELSSFMLAGLAVDCWSPHIAVICNLAPNHLDWHGNFEAYVKAKQVILDHQRPVDNDVCILGPGLTSKFRIQALILHTIEHSDADAITGSLLIPGSHNCLNAATALGTLRAVLNDQGAADVDLQQGLVLLGDFTGLAHRLQFVCQHEEVRFFNDSKATTPEASILAMRSFDRGKVHVILGGYDKGSDLTEMANCAAEHCRGIYTVGTTGQHIASLVQQASGSVDAVTYCQAVDKAVEQATRRARRGDIVLLSPGCASWDQFDNFQSRGSAFVEAVLRYTSEGAPPPPFA